MNPLPHRLVIYPKDVMAITGRSERYARNLLSMIRKQKGGKQGALVSLEEFCRYTGLKEEEVRGVLN